MKKDLSPVYDLIRADGSIVVNKALCFAIGLNETIVYSELLSKYNYFNIREELDEEGYFFNTIDDFERATTLDDKHQKKAITNLEKKGLIKTKLKGLPAKRHFMIVDDVQLILNYIKFGKNKIEVLEEKQKLEREKSIQRRKEREEERQSKLNQLFLQNGETGLEYKEKLVTPNWSVNNTDFNYTNFNNTSGGSGTDEIREGTISTPSKSIPFYDYITKLLKQCKTDYKAEILESIIYYYSKYKETLGIDHVRYKKDKCIEIISRLDFLYSIGIEDEGLGTMRTNITIDMFKSMVDKHFQTKYKKIQYTLLSFLNDNILKNRYYEIQNKEN